MKKCNFKIKKILIGCFSVLLAACALQYSPDSQAGQTYYYDLQGNLISAEEYEKLLRKLNRNKITTDTLSEELGSSPQVSTPDDAGQYPQSDESNNEEESSEEESRDKESSDEENEDENNEDWYRVEVSSETFVQAFRRDKDSENDSLVVPAYEYLRMDFGALDQEGLSFHLYGWGPVRF